MLVSRSLTPTNSAVKQKTSVDSTPMPKRPDGSVSRRQRGWISTVLLVCSLTTHHAYGFVASRPRSTQRSVRAQSSNSNGRERTLGLLTFDLDDTLFPISPVVRDANQKMVSNLERLGYKTTVPAFLETTRVVRRMLDQPVTYTALRKMAIEAEMKRLGGNNQEAPADVARLVDECYQVWEDERHAAAGRYLFADSIPMLQAVKRRFPDVCIAAITNGKGNPLRMPGTLGDLFEFCVSGEDEDVFPNRKPHPDIYAIARAKYRDRYSHHAEETHAWCHVGDCLANDVGASAACGAYAVWFTPESSSAVAAGAGYRYSTASPQEKEERAKKAQAAEELVAVRIASLVDLPDALARLLTV